MTADGARLETGRLVLRPVTLDDAELMLAIWNDPAFVRNVGDRGIRTIADAKKALEQGPLKLFADYGYGPFTVAVKTSGTRIGVCGLFRRPNLEDPDIGFALLPDYCEKGYAGEAARAIVEYARDDLRLPRLAAIVSPGNAPSIGLIEKLGLTFDRMITMPGDDDEVALYTMTFRRE